MAAAAEAKLAAKAAAEHALEEELHRRYEEWMQRSFIDLSMPMSEAERAAEAERLRNKALAEARAAEGDDAWRLRLERQARILDFDPKQPCGRYYNRLVAVDLAEVDLHEESPRGPMRFTDEHVHPRRRVCDGVNILSIKIASSDVGFPVLLYGTVVARDCVDRKYVDLFRRDKHHPQLINSEDDTLILTGPKRGLPLMDDDYVEFDLKIKDHQGQEREFSKGYLTIRGIGRPFDKCTIESESLATRLSTMDVIYAVVGHAVEATIAVEVLRGDFCGKITAYTTNRRNSLVLYDSKLAVGMTFDGTRVIHLMRPAVSVCLEDRLYIVAQTGDGKSQRTINFTPRANGIYEDGITIGVIRMRVKVAWSSMY